jgi:hypothetical protein
LTADDHTLVFEPLAHYPPVIVLEFRTSPRDETYGSRRQAPVAFASEEFAELGPSKAAGAGGKA